MVRSVGRIGLEELDSNPPHLRALGLRASGPLALSFEP